MFAFELVGDLRLETTQVALHIRANIAVCHVGRDQDRPRIAVVTLITHRQVNTGARGGCWCAGVRCASRSAGACVEDRAFDLVDRQILFQPLRGAFLHAMQGAQAHDFRGVRVVGCDGRGRSGAAIVAGRAGPLLRVHGNLRAARAAVNGKLNIGRTTNSDSKIGRHGHQRSLHRGPTSPANDRRLVCLRRRRFVLIARVAERYLAHPFFNERLFVAPFLNLGKPQPGLQLAALGAQLAEPPDHNIGVVIK
jgi:hypothetical protein